MSECDEAMLYAYNKGYRVTEDGRLINPKGVEIFGSKDCSGYVFMTIRMNKKFCRVKVHRLAAYQKYGDCMFEAECVRHLNGNPSDFSLSNIDIGSLSQNMMDIPKEKRIINAKKAASYITKYSTEEVLEIKKIYKEVGSYRKTMKRFGIKSTGTLHFIINKR